MIAQIQAMGAKVIVQTYPPYRYGNLRNVDAFLRRWWEKRQDKSSVTFMDVGKMLETKFSQKNGGEKYYSSDYGPRDDHQNGLGYKEIALLMEPLIP